MRKILIGLILLAALVIGWWYASPIWTLHAIRDAAKQHDAAQVSEYVDYPALREDLKASLPRYLSHEAARLSDNEGAKFAPMIALVVVAPVVDAAVSPDGVEAIFKGEKYAKSAPVSIGDEPVIERDGFNTFRVHGKDGAKGALVFHRYGLGWKLAALDLPQPSGG